MTGPRRQRSAAAAWCRRNGRIVICREPAAAADSPLRWSLGRERGELWDRRFVVSLGRSAGPGPFLVRRLGTDGLARARALAQAAGTPLRSDRIPRAGASRAAGTVRP